MKREFSIYLDLLRFGAAGVVFLAHLSWKTISGGFLWQLQPLGHDAVIVFFVLSGFVIHHVATRKEHELRDYATSRLARLYSVVVPAIVLTLVCDSIGMRLDPSLYDFSKQSEPVARAVSSVLFLSYVWYWDFALFSNGSFWSLPYEFWYYVLFGAAFYLSGTRRVVAVIVAAIIAGPNILLLLPIWLLGVLAHIDVTRRPPSPRAALFIFASSAVAFFALLAFDLLGLIPRAHTSALPPSFTVVDYVLGAAVAANIYAASGLTLRFPRALGVLIQKAAGYTFSLYLYHLPLLLLFASFIPTQWSPIGRAAILIAGVGCCVVGLGAVTEQRKTAWRDMIARALSVAVPVRST